MDPSVLYNTITLSNFDRALTQMVGRCQQRPDPWVLLIVALVCKFASQGHVCLDLEHLVSEGVPDDESMDRTPLNISLNKLLRRLSASPAVGSPGDFKPLIRQGNRLYLHRFWRHENDVAQDLRTRCTESDAPSGIGHTHGDLRKWFPMANSQQIEALKAALTKSMTVISGGPGSGKTFTIAMLIVLLYRMAPAKGVRIRLAAPTGKAAFRLQAAVRRALQRMVDDSENGSIEFESAQTIHRLLGALPGQATYKFNAKRKLPTDIVVVDEASMIDLGMMANLLAAMSTRTRLILLGDKDQLASVSPGSVLGDICSGVESSSDSLDSSDHPQIQRPPCANHIVMLEKRYRFSSGGGIDLLGRAIKNGQTQKALALFEDPDLPEVNLKSVEDPAIFESAIHSVAWRVIADRFACDDPAEALAQLEKHVILSPLRNGPRGVKALNAAVKQALVARNLIPIGSELPSGEWYAGRPIMITRNDYEHHLFNGDVGVTMAERTPRGIRFNVLFSEAGEGVKQISTDELTHYETAYALTVHKSQGSEFERVVLVLPNQINAVLSRQLLYTAVTRARTSVEVWGTAKVFCAAVNTNIERMSGLAQALWKA